MVRVLKLFAAVACLVLGLDQLALAQTLQASAIALTPGNFLTIDNVKITVGSIVTCSQGANGTGCGDLYMVPNSGPNASVIIEAANGTTPGVSLLEPLESETCTSFCSSGNYDLSVQLTATAVTGTAPLTAASVAIAGSLPSGGNGARIGGSESFTGVNYNGCSSGLSVTLASAAAAKAACSFAASSSIQATKDFGISLGVTNGVSGVYQLATITETFATPEPASLACLLTGIIAIGAIQIRRRRRALPRNY